MPLSVTVIGLGVMGKHHISKIQSLKEARLVGVVDTNSDVLAGIELPRCIGKYKSIADAGGFDAAIIATPPTTHFKIASELLENGIHCLVEKPICTNAHDAKELVRIAADKGVVCASGHIERFNPALIEATRRAGRFLYIEAERIGPFPERSTDADVIQDLMIHDLDALGAFNPGRPVDVRAVGIPVLTDRIDIANARIEFDGGGIVSLTASRVSMERNRKFRIFSKNGYYSADLMKRKLKILTLGGGGDHKEISGDVWEAGIADQLLEQDASFVNACLENKKPLTDAVLSIPAMELMDRIKGVIRTAE